MSVFKRVFCYHDAFLQADETIHYQDFTNKYSIINLQTIFTLNQFYSEIEKAKENVEVIVITKFELIFEFKISDDFYSVLDNIDANLFIIFDNTYILRNIRESDNIIYAPFCTREELRERGFRSFGLLLLDDLVEKLAHEPKTFFSIIDETKKSWVKGVQHGAPLNNAIETIYNASIPLYQEQLKKVIGKKYLFDFLWCIAKNMSPTIVFKEKSLHNNFAKFLKELEKSNLIRCFPAEQKQRLKYNYQIRGLLLKRYILTISPSDAIKNYLKRS